MGARPTPFSDKITETYTHVLDDRAVGTRVESGGSLNVVAGGNLLLEGAQLSTQASGTLTAGGDTVITAAEDTHAETRRRETAKSNFLSQLTGPLSGLLPDSVTKIRGALPPGAQLTGARSADTLNQAGAAKGWSPPYVPGTQVVEITTTQSAQFVRVYVEGSSSQAGGWIMRAEDIQGLTPQQIASKFSLPEVPTMMTDVAIPAGTTLEVSAANGISPNINRTGTRTGDNGGGGGVQFQIKTEFGKGQFENLFTNPRPLPQALGGS